MQKEFWEAYRDKGLLVVAVDLGPGQEKFYSASEVGLAKSYRDNHHLTFPVLMDADKTSSPVFRKRGIAIPYNVVVDDQMVVRYSGFSLNPMNRRVAELLSTP